MKVVLFIIIFVLFISIIRADTKVEEISQNEFLNPTKKSTQEEKPKETPSKKEFDAKTNEKPKVVKKTKPDLTDEEIFQKAKKLLEEQKSKDKKTKPTIEILKKTPTKDDVKKYDMNPNQFKNIKDEVEDMNDEDENFIKQQEEIDETTGFEHDEDNDLGADEQGHRDIKSTPQNIQHDEL
eukprot:gene5910-9740_t